MPIFCTYVNRAYEEKLVPITRRNGASNGPDKMSWRSNWLWRVPRMGCSGYLPSFLMLIIPGRLFLLCSVEELCEPICPKKSKCKDPLFTDPSKADWWQPNSYEGNKEAVLFCVDIVQWYPSFQEKVNAFKPPPEQMYGKHTAVKQHLAFLAGCPGVGRCSS